MQRFLIILLFIAVSLFAQTADDKDATFGINFSGFVKTDVMYDSRQSVTARFGHFLFYPEAEKLDPNGKDINDVNSFNILAIQTRLKLDITAPDVLGAKSSGLIEAAFFGISNGDVNGMRLRHAFLKLDWEKSSLLLGQYWHPMFITEVYPGTISFNTGVPFQPFSRNPQIRFTYMMDNFSLSTTASTQRDFLSTGPSGANCAYLRNTGIPMLDLTVKYKTKDLVFGAGVNYKVLLPNLSNTDTANALYKADEKISSLSFMGFGKIVFDEMVIKSEVIYGENLYDMLMLGGYAVSDTTADANGFASEYTNLKTLSGWIDIVYGKEFQYGLFAGYTENLGAEDNILGEYYSRGSDIASVMRISPRVQYSIGKTRYAVEGEYTTAYYGTPDIKGVVKNTTSVENMRLLVAAYLFF